MKEELMYMNPRIAIYHDVVTPSEVAMVRRLARPRVRLTRTCLICLWFVLFNELN